MAVKFPDPITAENFPSAWACADGKLRRAKKASRMFRAASGMAYLIFMLFLLVPALGLLNHYGDSTVQYLLSKIPAFFSLLERLEQLFLSCREDPVQLGVKLAAVFYGIPFAAGLLPAALVLLLYHPKGQSPDPDDDALAQARQLRQLLAQARKLDQSSRITSITLTNVCFGLIICCILFFSYYTPLTGPSRVDMLTEGGMPHMYFVGIPLLMAGVLALMTIYWLISLPLTLVLKLMCLCPVPKKVLTEADRWIRRCEKNQTPQPVSPAQEDPSPEQPPILP